MWQQHLWPAPDDSWFLDTVHCSAPPASSWTSYSSPQWLLDCSYDDTSISVKHQKACLYTQSLLHYNRMVSEQKYRILATLSGISYSGKWKQTSKTEKNSKPITITLYNTLTRLAQRAPRLNLSPLSFRSVCAEGPGRSWTASCCLFCFCQVWPLHTCIVLKTLIRHSSLGKLLL